MIEKENIFPLEGRHEYIQKDINISRTIADVYHLVKFIVRRGFQCKTKIVKFETGTTILATTTNNSKNYKSELQVPTHTFAF